MRDKPGNILLAVFAALLLADTVIEGFMGGGSFLISFGVFGALLSRALLNDPQPIAVVLLGLALTLIAVGRNHGIIDFDSGLWFVLALFLAVVYAWWEKITEWFSI
jgi:hypothetical protein